MGLESDHNRLTILIVSFVIHTKEEQFRPGTMGMKNNGVAATLMYPPNHSTGIADLSYIIIDADSESIAASLIPEPDCYASRREINRA